MKFEISERLSVKSGFVFMPLSDLKTLHCIRSVITEAPGVTDDELWPDDNHNLEI
jgi:hypothetical protein